MKNRMVGGVIGGFLAGLTMPVLGPFAALLGAFSALAIANTMEASSKKKTLPNYPVNNTDNLSSGNPIQPILPYNLTYNVPEIKRTLSNSIPRIVRQENKNVSIPQTARVPKNEQHKILIDRFGRIFDPDDE